MNEKVSASPSLGQQSGKGKNYNKNLLKLTPETKLLNFVS